MLDSSPPSRGILRLAGIVLAALFATGAAASSLIGRPAPDFALKGLDGNNLRLSEYRGQVVLINFWARWAGDSRVEMPALDRLDKTYRRAGLVVLGVSVDEDATRAGEFATAMRVSYPILFDTGPRIGRGYFLGTMPTTVLVDRSGIVRYVKVGYKAGDDRAFIDQIRELLRE